jgi:transcriptional regulator with XRE-family HTH domain
MPHKTPQKSQDQPPKERLVFARNFNSRCKELGVSQIELCRRIGMSASFLSKVLKGKQNVSLDTAVRMADAIGIPLHVLLTPTDATW